MQPSHATWSFERTQPNRSADEPVRLDALHALQCWRAAQAGRGFKLVPGSPFQWTERVQAKLTHAPDDHRAGNDLCTWCQEHRIAAITLPG